MKIWLIKQPFAAKANVITKNYWQKLKNERNPANQNRRKKMINSVKLSQKLQNLGILALKKTPTVDKKKQNYLQEKCYLDPLLHDSGCIRET